MRVCFEVCLSVGVKKKFLFANALASRLPALGFEGNAGDLATRTLFADAADTCISKKSRKRMQSDHMRF